MLIIHDTSVSISSYEFRCADVQSANGGLDVVLIQTPEFRVPCDFSSDCHHITVQGIATRTLRGERALQLVEPTFDAKTGQIECPPPGHLQEHSRGQGASQRAARAADADAEHPGLLAGRVRSSRRGLAQSGSGCGGGGQPVCKGSQLNGVSLLLYALTVCIGSLLVGVPPPHTAALNPQLNRW